VRPRRERPARHPQSLPGRPQPYSSDPDFTTAGGSLIGLADFRNPAIKTERALKRDPDYKPQFVNYPLQIEELDIDLDDEDMRQLKRLTARGLADDAEDAVRSGAMTWYTKNRTLQSQPEALDFDIADIREAARPLMTKQES